MVLLTPEGSTHFAAFCIDRYEYPNVFGAFPAVLKTWDDAKADCNRMHKRLCTADEWERACRGPRNREYSGMNQYDPEDGDGCNGADNSGHRSRITPSGTRKKCLSGYAVSDLSGNAAEWTATIAEGNPANRLIKGGSVEGGAADIRCASSVAQPRSTMSDVVGFRCCVDRP
jgi:formylglycine-generating enzyme required for sulfatase activity